MKKQNWILLIVFTLLVSFLLSLEWFMFTNAKILCGKITRQTSQAKGGYSLRYIFYIDGKKIEGKMPNSEIKDISLDSLKQIECIKIEVSNYSTSFNRIVDRRILVE